VKGEKKRLTVLWRVHRFVL